MVNYPSLRKWINVFSGIFGNIPCDSSKSGRSTTFLEKEADRPHPPAKEQSHTMCPFAQKTGTIIGEN